MSRGHTIAVTVKGGIERGDAPFQSRSYLGIALSVSQQMSVTGLCRKLGIECGFPAWEQIADGNTAEGGLRMNAVIVDAGGQQELFDQHVEAALLWQVGP